MPNDDEKNHNVFEDAKGVGDLIPGWTFTQWWRVIGLDDRPKGLSPLWCETTDEDEARVAFTNCPYPCELQHLQRRSDERWVKVP